MSLSIISLLVTISISETNQTVLSALMLSVIMMRIEFCTVELIVIMLSVNMLIVIMLIVIMLSVVAPSIQSVFPTVDQTVQQKQVFLDPCNSFFC